jgi:ankyrin repeat protein
MVSTLLDFGACPNVRDVRGRTPLHYAVETGDPLLVWWLRRRGGDPDVKDEEGHTPADRMTWKTAYLAPILYWPA